MLLFYTDPHLGQSRSANTTPSSALALKQALYEQAMRVVSTPDCTKICVGDMFDRFSNSEQDMRQGFDVMKETSIVLAGNHDLVNQDGKVGSLQMLDHAFEKLEGKRRCEYGEFGKPYSFGTFFEKEKAFVAGVPHVGLQEVFEQSLEEAMTRTRNDATEGYTKFLLLHCNFDMSPERLTETSLNLTGSNAQRLLEVFDYIILGHEHAPANHFGGRLVILGNTHPTGFADISDKRVAMFDGERLTFTPIWNTEVGYEEFSYMDIPKSTDASFVKITGQIQAGDMLELTRTVNRLWKKSQFLYCVKIDVSLPSLEIGDGEAAAKKLSQLPTVVREELKDRPDLRALWDELLQEEQDHA